MRKFFITFYIILAFPFLIKAETGVIYLSGICTSPTDKIELGWFIPMAIGSHKTTTDNWLKRTPLGEAYDRFMVLFETGGYELIYDLDADGQVLPFDYDLLIDRWAGQPSIWGNKIKVKLNEETLYPPRACVTITWPEVFVTPSINLYQSCVSANGIRLGLGPNGEEWRGPSIFIENPNCEGGNF